MTPRDRWAEIKRAHEARVRSHRRRRWLVPLGCILMVIIFYFILKLIYSS